MPRFCVVVDGGAGRAPSRLATSRGRKKRAAPRAQESCENTLECRSRSWRDCATGRRRVGEASCYMSKSKGACVSAEELVLPAARRRHDQAERSARAELFRAEARVDPFANRDNTTRWRRSKAVAADGDVRPAIARPPRRRSLAARQTTRRSRAELGKAREVGRQPAPPAQMDRAGSNTDDREASNRCGSAAFERPDESRR